jgi:DNA polymerase III epsilon subunit family exonuclease
MEKDFVVIDIETTGLSSYYHKITEIAALKYSNGKIQDEFVTLVNPEVHIPHFITRLTGITDEMVKGQPKVNEVLPGLREFLSDDIFVGHNVGFDYKFIEQASLKNLGLGLNNPTLCTCKLARRLLPELPSKKLGSLCTHFNITNDQAHRAKADALATAKILENMLLLLKEKDIHKVEDVLNFQKTKIPKMQLFS